jgi:uncharacterized cupin superfamily protein
MSFILRLLLFVCIVVFVASANAQVPPKLPTAQYPDRTPIRPGPVNRGPFQPSRDSQAVAAVQTAITSLGGDTAISQIHDFKAQGQAQGAKGSQGMSGTITWEKSGGEFRVELANNGTSSVLVSGRGRITSVMGEKNNALADHVVKTYFNPELVSTELRDAFQNSNCSIRYHGQSSLNGKPVSVVWTAWVPAGATYIVGRMWYFDVATGLPVKVEYGVPAAQTTAVWFQASVLLSDWRPINGVQYPFNIASSVQGRPFQTIALQSVNSNATISASDFDAPLGGAQ